MVNEVITQNKKKGCFLACFIMLLFLLPTKVYADTAPTINILKGNPSEKVNPPYTVTFEVSDTAGISSISVNGRELNPRGATYYEADWSTYYNGTIIITATNRDGGTSSKTLEITNISNAVAPATAAPTTAAPTTVARTTVPQTTESLVETEPESDVEMSLGDMLEPELETIDALETLQGEFETELESETQTDASIEEETTEVETTPAIPPDSYKLYAGGRKNMTIPLILIDIVACVIIYCIITIFLNRKRLHAYKQLQDVLLKRKEQKEKQRNRDEDRGIENRNDKDISR